MGFYVFNTNFNFNFKLLFKLSLTIFLFLLNFIQSSWCFSKNNCFLKRGGRMTRGFRSLFLLLFSFLFLTFPLLAENWDGKLLREERFQPNPREREVNSSNSFLPSAEQEALNGITDDFLVNDDGGNQEDPAIARDPSGNFVITWEDYRNGNYDIYFQRYNSSGTPLGTNFKVNDDIGTSDQYSPAIAMDGSGNFVIAWTDGRSGGGDIYAQRFNSAGTALGANFKVNDDVGTADQGAPAVAHGWFGQLCDYLGGLPQWQL
jgi:hypothetical protein